jgi:hypothetical protein
VDTVEAPALLGLQTPPTAWSFFIFKLGSISMAGADDDLDGAI